MGHNPFERPDTDRDGLLTQEEIRKRREQRRERMHERRSRRQEGMKKLRELDRDGDPALSRAGIGDQLPRLGENFDLLDSDRDGKLTREEMRASRSKMRPESAGQ